MKQGFKKLISILLMLAMVLTFAACGSNDNDDDDEDEDDSPRKTNKSSFFSKDKSDKDSKSNKDEEESKEKDNDNSDKEDIKETDEKSDNDSDKEQDSESQSTSDTDAAADFLKYTSKDGSLTFQYPSEWNEMNIEGVEKVFLISLTGDNFLFLAQPVPEGTEQSIKEFSAAFIEGVKTTAEVSEVEESTTEVGTDSYPAVILKYKMKQGEMDMYQKSVIIVKNNTAYILTFTSVDDKVDEKFEESIVPVLETITIK